MKGRLAAVLGIGGVMGAAAALIGVRAGAVEMPWAAMVDLLQARWFGGAASSSWPDMYGVVLFQLRIPRVALAAVAGAGLAVAGALFQTLLRNPLGDPFLLGVSAGAGFGATLAIAGGVLASAWGIAGVSLAAMLAACGTMAVVYGLARVGGRLPVATLVLGGVVVSSMLSALTLLVAAVVENRFAEIMMWLMGRVEVSDPRLLAMAAVVVLPAIGAAWLAWRELNALRFGEETAGHLGVPVERMKVGLLALASLMTAAAVSATGLIGFVGLVVPHAVRGLVGSDHRLVIPGSALGGAALLILADVGARTLVAPVELPVGIVTALVGGPFFLVLLRRERKVFSS